MAIRPDQRAIVVLANCLCDATDLLHALRAEHERAGVTEETRSMIRATIGPLEEATEYLAAAMAGAVGSGTMVPARELKR